MIESLDIWYGEPPLITRIINLLYLSLLCFIHIVDIVPVISLISRRSFSVNDFCCTHILQAFCHSLYDRRLSSVQIVQFGVFSCVISLFVLLTHLFYWFRYIIKQFCRALHVISVVMWSVSRVRLSKINLCRIKLKPNSCYFLDSCRCTSSFRILYVIVCITTSYLD